ncbi:MAG: hypothetical protein QG635_1885, partial [Bacteroidota bacterium]|nr:hypothetical protein [Bacteroidota bacterium]
SKAEKTKAEGKTMGINFYKVNTLVSSSATIRKEIFTTILLPKINQD